MTKKRVAIQGTKASFHEEAAFKFFDEAIDILECKTFRNTCEAMREGRADYVVMAIENSIAGSLLPNYGLLREFRFRIIAEAYLHIQLHLMALPGVSLDDIRIVESHPIAIQQCNDFLAEHPALRVVESEDTAACARKIKQDLLWDTAAIANQYASQTYGLHILERRIETHKKNFTRFLLLTREMTGIEGSNKASLSFQTGNNVGALVDVLRCFSEENINLSKIQSMPVVGRRNEYEFYVDVEWENTDDYRIAIQRALKYAVNFNIMGEYIKNDRV